MKGGEGAQDRVLINGTSGGAFSHHVGPVGGYERHGIYIHLISGLKAEANTLHKSQSLSTTSRPIYSSKMSKTDGITRASICTTISPPATQQTRSIITEDDPTCDTALLTYLRPTLKKEIAAGHERGISETLKAIDVEVDKEHKRLEDLDWTNRDDALINENDAQSNK